jgi:hypothetical protein
VATPAAAQTPAAAASPPAPAAIVSAANAFLAGLTAAQRTQAALSFDDAAAKAQWSNLPAGLFRWNGVKMGDLSETQRESARAVLRLILSPSGYERVMASVRADETLRVAAGANNNQQYGSDNYFVAVFGTPSAEAPWMFRFGGHHVTVNATMVGSNLALTPSFPGCEPCEFSADGRTLVPGGDQLTTAFRFLESLDATQRQQAVIGQQPIDLVLGPTQAMRTVAPEGLRLNALTAAQQAAFVELARTYIGIANSAAAEAKLAEVRAGLADTYFIWRGPTAAGSSMYYRIQGPAVWIEYSGMGNQRAASGGANHVHSIYRDPSNEYGAKWVTR